MTTVKLWGTRGSMASPGSDTARYGGNTSCVEVRANDGSLIILDAGSGIRALGRILTADVGRIDLLLTHLHLDHILGLGFFAPLQNPKADVHIWGPSGTSFSLEKRLMRYLSPPYFPLFMNEFACKLTLHEVSNTEFDIGSVHVVSEAICHPGPTVGFRLTTDTNASVAYLPDHEPALGVDPFPDSPEWTSGFGLAENVDLLIHDAQYTHGEYVDRVGWGHSTIQHMLAFGAMCAAKEVVSFHYDPSHDDDTLDNHLVDATNKSKFKFKFTPGTEGAEFDLP